MANRMRIEYDKYYDTPDKMNPLVSIAPVFDPTYKLVGLQVSLCELLVEAQGSVVTLKVREKLEA